MSGIRLPAPGTLAAQDRGCTCEVTLRQLGQTLHARAGCPLHGVVAPTTDNGEDNRRATPHRFSGAAL